MTQVETDDPTKPTSQLIIRNSKINIFSDKYVKIRSTSRTKKTCDPFSRTVAVVVNWHSAWSSTLKSEPLSIAAHEKKFSLKNTKNKDKRKKKFKDNKWRKCKNVGPFQIGHLQHTCTLISCSLICGWIYVKWSGNLFIWFHYKKLFLHALDRSIQTIWKR